MMSSAERAAADAAIVVCLRALPDLRRASQILAYLALPDEPSLSPLLISAAQEGTPVFAPVVMDRTRMSFVRWLPRDGLRPGVYGAWLPSSAEIPLDAASVAFVPGRAFDECGNRLGRGAGCYDRILDTISGFATVVGVTYDCQIFERVPREDHDRSVDVVVSERRTIRVERGSRLRK